MARSPVPILVVPKPGVTVMLDGAVVPALGLETTVDDELANELLKGTLDEFPAAAPLVAITGASAGLLAGLTVAASGTSQPTITGAGQAQQPGLTGVGAGVLRIVGDAGAANILDLSANQPPGSVALPAFMQSGSWRFTFTQSSFAGGPMYALLSIGGVAVNSLFLYGDGTTVGGSHIQVYAGGARGSAFMSWSVGQPVTIVVDMTRGTLTISGATTGNGSYALSGAPFSWPSGTLGVGRDLTTPGAFDFAGTISNITSGGPALAGLVGAATGTAPSISGAGAGVLAGLVGSAQPMPDPGAGNALMVNAAGDYLVNAAGDYLYGKQ